VVADQDQTLSNLGQESAYYIAICYYLENKDSDAIAAFRKLISVYPTSQWVPEAYYHIGLIQFRSGQTVEGISTMNQLIHDYPGVQWANYAKDRLAEKKVINHD
jgi:TolA-binding protein